MSGFSLCNGWVIEEQVARQLQAIADRPLVIHQLDHVIVETTHQFVRRSLPDRIIQASGIPHAAQASVSSAAPVRWAAAASIKQAVQEPVGYIRQVPVYRVAKRKINVSPHHEEQQAADEVPLDTWSSERSFLSTIVTPAKPGSVPRQSTIFLSKSPTVLSPQLGTQILESSPPPGPDVVQCLVVSTALILQNALSEDTQLQVVVEGITQSIPTSAQMPMQGAEEDEYLVHWLDLIDMPVNPDDMDTKLKFTLQVSGGEELGVATFDLSTVQSVVTEELTLPLIMAKDGDRGDLNVFLDLRSVKSFAARFAENEDTGVVSTPPVDDLLAEFNRVMSLTHPASDVFNPSSPPAGTKWSPSPTQLQVVAMAKRTQLACGVDLRQAGPGWASPKGVTQTTGAGKTDTAAQDATPTLQSQSGMVAPMGVDGMASSHPPNSCMAAPSMRSSSTLEETELHGVLNKCSSAAELSNSSGNMGCGPINAQNVSQVATNYSSGEGESDGMAYGTLPEDFSILKTLSAPLAPNAGGGEEGSPGTPGGGESGGVANGTLPEDFYSFKKLSTPLAPNAGEGEEGSPEAPGLRYHASSASPLARQMGGLRNVGSPDAPKENVPTPPGHLPTESSMTLDDVASISRPRPHAIVIQNGKVMNEMHLYGSGNNLQPSTGNAKGPLQQEHGGYGTEADRVGMLQRTASAQQGKAAGATSMAGVPMPSAIGGLRQESNGALNETISTHHARPHPRTMQTGKAMNGVTLSMQQPSTTDVKELDAVLPVPSGGGGGADTAGGIAGPAGSLRRIHSVQGAQSAVPEVPSGASTAMTTAGSFPRIARKLSAKSNGQAVSDRQGSQTLTSEGSKSSISSQRQQATMAPRRSDLSGNGHPLGQNTHQPEAPQMVGQQDLSSGLQAVESHTQLPVQYLNAQSLHDVVLNGTQLQNFPPEQQIEVSGGDQQMSRAQAMEQRQQPYCQGVTGHSTTLDGKDLLGAAAQSGAVLGDGDTETRKPAGTSLSTPTSAGDLPAQDSTQLSNTAPQWESNVSYSAMGPGSTLNGTQLSDIPDAEGIGMSSDGAQQDSVPETASYAPEGLPEGTAGHGFVMPLTYLNGDEALMPWVTGTNTSPGPDVKGAHAFRKVHGKRAAQLHQNAPIVTSTGHSLLEDCPTPETPNFRGINLGRDDSLSPDGAVSTPPSSMSLVSKSSIPHQKSSTLKNKVSQHSTPTKSQRSAQQSSSTTSRGHQKGTATMHSVPRPLDAHQNQKSLTPWDTMGPAASASSASYSTPGRSKSSNAEKSAAGASKSERQVASRSADGRRGLRAMTPKRTTNTAASPMMARRCVSAERLGVKAVKLGVALGQLTSSGVASGHKGTRTSSSHAISSPVRPITVSYARRRSETQSIDVQVSGSHTLEVSGQPLEIAEEPDATPATLFVSVVDSQDLVEDEVLLPWSQSTRVARPLSSSSQIEIPMTSQQSQELPGIPVSLSSLSSSNASAVPPPVAHPTPFPRPVHANTNLTSTSHGPRTAQRQGPRTPPRHSRSDAVTNADKSPLGKSPGRPGRRLAQRKVTRSEPPPQQRRWIPTNSGESSGTSLQRAQTIGGPTSLPKNRRSGCADNNPQQQQQSPEGSPTHHNQEPPTSGDTDREGATSPIVPPLLSPLFARGRNAQPAAGRPFPLQPVNVRMKRRRRRKRNPGATGDHNVVHPANVTQHRQRAGPPRRLLRRRLRRRELSPDVALSNTEDSADEQQHHAYIGLEMTDSLWLRATRVRHGYGALKVIRVKDHSPAAKSGIQMFDFILQVNARRTPSLRLFKSAFQKLQPGMPCKLIIQRRHKRLGCKLVPTVAQRQPGARHCRAVVAAVCVLKNDGKPAPGTKADPYGVREAPRSPHKKEHSPQRSGIRKGPMSTGSELDHSIVNVQTPRVILDPMGSPQEQDGYARLLLDGYFSEVNHPGSRHRAESSTAPLSARSAGSSEGSSRGTYRNLTARSANSQGSARQMHREPVALLLSGIDLALSVREPKSAAPSAANAPRSPSMIRMGHAPPPVTVPRCSSAPPQQRHTSHSPT